MSRPDSGRGCEGDLQWGEDVAVDTASIIKLLNY